MQNKEHLESFVAKVKDFDQLSSSKQIDYFVYFLTIENQGLIANIGSIRECFNHLKTAPYSNISSYLASNSKKGRGFKPKFINEKGTFHLLRAYKIELENTLGIAIPAAPTNNYFPLSIFDHTRSHLVKIAVQACKSYDYQIFDGCAVLTRKLIEILIIETFERHGIDHKIKDANGYFFYLSDLIQKLLEETKWTIGRNAKQAIHSLKKMGDQSAHNRRYFAQPSDIEKIKDDLRIVLDELVHLIDYPSWNRELAANKIS